MIISRAPEYQTQYVLITIEQELTLSSTYYVLHLCHLM